MVAIVEQRVSQLLRWPVSNIDSLTVTHYKQGGQRLATLIVYLNEVEAGGATVFPKLGLQLRPKRGAAAYFLSHEPDGRINPSNLHAGAPVEAGEKWIATFWLREGDHRRHLMRVDVNADCRPRVSITGVFHVD